jgi:Trypsin
VCKAAPLPDGERSEVVVEDLDAHMVDDGKHRMCTVELIDPQIAITARHCTLDNDYLARTEIVFGGVRTDGNELLPTGPRQTVAEVHRNEDADVALLRLTGPVDGIAPIALPSPEFANAVQSGSAVSVVGWGNLRHRRHGYNRAAAGRTHRPGPVRQQHVQPVHV